MVMNVARSLPSELAGVRNCGHLQREKENVMAYTDEAPQQLGSEWIAAQNAKGRTDTIEEARQAGALQDLLTGKDPDRTCSACGGTGQAAK